MSTTALDPRIAAELMAELGFLLVPGGRVGAPAYLFVALRRRPTLEHYDPEVVQYWNSTNGRGLPEELTFRTSVPLRTEFSWGSMRLIDRLRVSNEYLAFGGSLSAERVDGALVAVFRSPAPLLMRGGHSQGWDMGAHSVAAFFGRLRAAVGADLSLEAAVAEAAPLTRYSAFVADAMTRYGASDLLRTLNSPVWRWLHRESRRLRGESPAEWAAAERLLAQASLDLPTRTVAG
jgi:hypothetical protein